MRLPLVAIKHPTHTQACTALPEPNTYLAAQLRSPPGPRMWLPLEKTSRLCLPLCGELNGEEQSFGKGSRDTPSCSPQSQELCQSWLWLFCPVNPLPSHLSSECPSTVAHSTSWITSLPANYGHPSLAWGGTAGIWLVSLGPHRPYRVRGSEAVGLLVSWLDYLTATR